MVQYHDKRMTILDIRKAHYGAELPPHDAGHELYLEKKVEVRRRLESVLKEFPESPNIVVW